MGQNDKVFIIHHNDADGRCAAAVVAKSLEKRDSIQCLEVDFKDLEGEKWKQDLMGKVADAHVWIVDFSLPNELMQSICRSASKVVWIDHHGTAAKYVYQDLPGLRDFSEKGPSAAELAWQFCFKDNPVPRVVVLVGDYDSWRLKEPDSSAMRVALEAKEWARDPLSDEWKECLSGDDAVPGLIDDGNKMLEFRDGYCETMAKTYGFEISDFEGLKCFALNVYGLGSQAFGKKMQEYDACVSLVFDGKHFTVGLYSENDDINCGKICQKYGGGGHKGAAGFQCTKLPWLEGD